MESLLLSQAHSCPTQGEPTARVQHTSIDRKNGAQMGQGKADRPNASAIGEHLPITVALLQGDCRAYCVKLQ
jgi:hypothetical protein